jgi:hypothetical protein
MIIVNYTPDDVFWEHVGANGIIKSGQMLEFPDNRGNFILNKFSPRGLLNMQFGDNTEDKQKAAMEIWTKFWTRQIIMYNQDNERRKNTNREYVEPTPEVRAHAERMGLQILGPWTINKADDAVLKMLREENNDLRSKVDMLSMQLGEIVKAIKGRSENDDVPFELRTVAEKVAVSEGVESKLKEVKPEPGKEDYAQERELINEFQMLNREKFGDWVMMNMDRLQSEDFPPAVLSLVKDKWERLIKSEFPMPADV